MLTLTSLVETMRQAKGSGYDIPDFDPLDGGTSARVLFLLEAPGPKAITSGFVSRNNPDETAKNFYVLNQEAGINRSDAIVWNAVPWYIGSASKIRPAKRSDVQEAHQWLNALVAQLTSLQYVVFVGKKALHAREVVHSLRPDIRSMEMPHPSPVFVNRHPKNRARILEVLSGLGRQLADT